MKELNDKTFETELSSGITVIDFWAPWCGPCKTIMPLVETIAESYEGTEVDIVKANVDECKELQTKFGIRSVPTFVVVKDGVETGRYVGSVSLTSKINELIEQAKLKT